MLYAESDDRNNIHYKWCKSVSEAKNGEAIYF